MEDDEKTIKNRLELYDEQIKPMIEYFKEIGIPIEHVNGVGTVGQVHDRIQEILESKMIVGAF